MKNHNYSWLNDDRHLLESWPPGCASGLTSLPLIAADRLGSRLKAHSLDLVLADVRRNDGDGFEILAGCRKNHPISPVVLIPAIVTVETGIEALASGPLTC